MTMFEGMLGDSEVMRAVFRTVTKVAPVKTSVLITGESGVGKELIARAIHRGSPRADGPFVAVNCGAIAETLLESELFGHARGAYTDAIEDRAGLFERASGGTIFLDEIGELPLLLQVKLLRVLQEEAVQRVGDHELRTIDVRVLSATHRDLEEETAAGRFRDDLLYRLNVVHVAVPALRERRADIPPLVHHFVARTNERLGTAIAPPDDEALARLCGYAWPGNVRELENVIERAMVLADAPVLGTADLPACVQRVPVPSRLSGEAAGEGGVVEAILAGGELSIKKAKRRVEAALIRRALEQTGGNRTRAAALLEISHKALLYKMKDYAIEG